MKFDEENSKRILDELMKDFEDNAMNVHICSYELENPSGRSKEHLEEAKNDLKEGLLRETAISKEISFLLYKMKQEGFTIKFVK